MSEGFDYWRGSLDGARQILLYATELLGDAIEMCERHLLCERWSSTALCPNYACGLTRRVPKCVTGGEK